MQIEWTNAVTKQQFFIHCRSASSKSATTRPLARCRPAAVNNQFIQLQRAQLRTSRPPIFMGELPGESKDSRFSIVIFEHIAHPGRNKYISGPYEWISSDMQDAKLPAADPDLRVPHTAAAANLKVINFSAAKSASPECRLQRRQPHAIYTLCQAALYSVEERKTKRRLIFCTWSAPVITKREGTTHRGAHTERCNPINKHTLHFLADLNSQITPGLLFTWRARDAASASPRALPIAQ